MSELATGSIDRIVIDVDNTDIIEESKKIVVKRQQKKEVQVLTFERCRIIVPANSSISDFKRHLIKLAKVGFVFEYEGLHKFIKILGKENSGQQESS